MTIYEIKYEIAGREAHTVVLARDDDSAIAKFRRGFDSPSLPDNARIVSRYAV